MRETRTTEVLAILPFEEDRLTLADIFRHSKWRLDLAASLQQSRVALERLQQAVVMCDAQLPDGNWKHTLHVLEDKAERAPLIVVSRFADDRMWAEVLNLGGYDVLETPFHKEEVVRSVSLAWRHALDQRWLSRATA